MQDLDISKYLYPIKDEMQTYKSLGQVPKEVLDIKSPKVMLSNATPISKDSYDIQTLMKLIK